MPCPDGLSSHSRRPSFYGTAFFDGRRPFLMAALRPAAVGRATELCPALSDFPVTPGDLHSTARPFLMADGLF